jgi:GxxExxY protein
MVDYPLKDQTFKIIGLCMEVHRELGYGYAEIVYKDALEIEAESDLIPTEREKEFDIYYKGKKLPRKFMADFVFFGNIIIEIKATAEGIAKDHIAQTLNYMKASELSVALIINFGKSSLEYKRLVL